MESNNIPTTGTRFTYSRFLETPYNQSRCPVEQWTGSVIRSYMDDLGDLTVEAEREDGGVETFWNDSWNQVGLYESIEIHR